MLRTLTHFAIVPGEPAHIFGRLDSVHPRTRAHLDQLAAAIDDIPRHRLEVAVRPDVMLDAGVLSGLVFHFGGFQPGRKVAALNNAVLLLHARARGYTVLTGGIRDFDPIHQVVPTGRVVFYRAH